MFWNFSFIWFFYRLLYSWFGKFYFSNWYWESMIFLIIFFMLALFSTFFYMIGLWYLSLLPLVVFIFMLSHWIKNIFHWATFEMLLEKWSLVLIWLITMIWLSWILFFIWIKEIYVYLDLLILNIFLWMSSHIFRYEDWKLLFEIWSWVMILIILWTSLFYGWFFVFCQTFSLLSCLMLGVYSFLQFVIGIFYPTDEKWLYEIVILWIVSLWATIIKVVYPADWIMFLCFIGLSLIFGVIYLVQNWEMPAKQTAKISVRRILAWERIFKKLNIPQRKISLHEWLEKSPKRFERGLEFFNLWNLIFLLLFFFWWIFTSSEIELGLRYWAGIAIFLVNVFLLKRINYASDVSRFSLSLIANFILYSVLLISWSSISSILPFLIVRGFCCQIAIFYVDRVNLSLFWEKDYVYWTVVTFLASVCNVVLMCNVDLPWQFLFSLIFVYVWIELMLLYYITKFLRERKEVIENAELEEKKVIKEIANYEINKSDDY